VHKTLEIDKYMELALTAGSVVFDARSPKEFAEGHIPGAINLPLMDNDQRHEIGITYKKQGHDAAVEKGFELVGPHFAEKLKRAKELTDKREILVYCWRGGLRSNILAWLLQTGGFKVTLLKGGYKAFRNQNMSLFSTQANPVILSGKTGVGKTEILEMLIAAKQHVVDLEGFANHKGSAFGSLGKEEQPNQEQFENLVANQLRTIPNDHSVWIESESRFIGKVRIPDLLFNRMKSAPILDVERPIEERVDRILTEYGHFPKDILAEKTAGLSKRMGGDQVKAALEFLADDNLRDWIRILLHYYDKGYTHSRIRKEEDLTECTAVIHVSSSTNFDETIHQLIDLANTWKKPQYQ